MLLNFSNLIPQIQALVTAVVFSAVLGAAIATQTGNPAMGAMVAYNNLRSMV